MPLPLETEITSAEPNTYRYDMSIVSRIEGDALKIAANAILTPARCDVDEAGVEHWTLIITDRERPGEYIPDLERYAVENPDLAPMVMQAWSALSALVAAINAKRRML